MDELAGLELIAEIGADSNLAGEHPERQAVCQLRIEGQELTPKLGLGDAAPLHPQR